MLPRPYKFICSWLAWTFRKVVKRYQQWWTLSYPAILNSSSIPCIAPQSPLLASDSFIIWFSDFVCEFSLFRSELHNQYYLNHPDFYHRSPNVKNIYLLVEVSCVCIVYCQGIVVQMQFTRLLAVCIPRLYVSSPGLTTYFCHALRSRRHLKFHVLGRFLMLAVVYCRRLQAQYYHHILQSNVHLQAHLTHQIGSQFERIGSSVWL